MRDTWMRRAYRAIYPVQTTLILCHEIDSAYWREWELFRLPGGAQGFLAIHLVLVALILWGWQAVLRDARGGRAMSVLLGLGGAGGAALHSAFLIAGDARFQAPLSVLLIGVMGVAGLVQLALTGLSAREAAGQGAR